MCSSLNHLIQPEVLAQVDKHSSLYIKFQHMQLVIYISIQIQLAMLYFTWSQQTGHTAILNKPHNKELNHNHTQIHATTLNWKEERSAIQSIKITQFSQSLKGQNPPQTKPKSITHFPLCPCPPPKRVKFTHLCINAFVRSKILSKTLKSANWHQTSIQEIMLFYCPGTALSKIMNELKKRWTVRC